MTNMNVWNQGKELILLAVSSKSPEQGVNLDLPQVGSWPEPNREEEEGVLFRQLNIMFNSQWPE